MTLRESAIQRSIIRVVKKEYGGWVVKVDEAVYGHEPDLHIYLPGGITVFLEVKQPGEGPTAGQRIRLDQYQALGFEAHVVTGLAEARRILSRVTAS